MPPKKKIDYREYMEDWLERNKKNDFPGMPRNVGFTVKFVIIGFLAMIDEIKEVLKDRKES